jgi:hypothetical protein
MCQDLRRHCGGESEANQRLDELSPRQATTRDLADELPDAVLVHVGLLHNRLPRPGGLKVT